MPHFKRFALLRPSDYHSNLLRALWGHYFAAAEQGFELEAVQIFLEIKNMFPQSRLLRLRKPYHIYWFGNRSKAYESFKALVEAPILDPNDSAVRVNFDEDALRKVVLEDFLALGEWIWAGELIETYPSLRGHVDPFFEAFARLQYGLMKEMEGQPFEPRELHFYLETLRSDTRVPFFPVALVMALAAKKHYGAARETFRKIQEIIKRFDIEDSYHWVFKSLFKFLEDAPPSSEKALFEDALRDNLEEQIPDLEIALDVKKEIKLPSNHERTLEKIFEPLVGLKRLHQVHLKRRQVEGLFEVLGCVGGFSRIAKGSHHLVGLKVPGHPDQRISTVLSADIVPHYQICQLQRLLKKVGVLPAKYRDQIEENVSALLE